MENEKNRQALPVSRAEAGQKLLNFLQRRVTAPSGELHRWIRTGQVRVNGGRAKAFDRVEEGDLVRVPPFAEFLPAGSASHEKSKQENRPGTATKKAAFQGGQTLKIVYEDDEILVIAKPAGLPVQGGTGHTDSVASRLAAERADADFVPAPVHRLDKDTTGLLVIGKTYAAIRQLTDALAGRGGEAPRKEYLAWVEGRWPNSADGSPQELHDFLIKDQKAQRMKTVRRAKEEEGQEARCIVTALETRRIPDGTKDREYTLLLVRLLTGRTHQIRVQLASRGHAIVGAPWYGKKEAGLKLHAFRLSIPLPDGSKRLLELLPPWKEAWKVTRV